jgi:hypothetical protein
MWKLHGRDNKIKRWSEYGEFHNIAHATKCILELEGDPNGALFFRLYVDPTLSPAKQRMPKSFPASNTRAAKVAISPRAHRFIKDQDGVEEVAARKRLHMGKEHFDLPAQAS